jgi:hypothetical protein
MGNFRVNIVQDSNPFNPRNNEQDVLGTILYSTEKELGDQRATKERIAEVLEDSSLIALPIHVVENEQGLTFNVDNNVSIENCNAVIYVSKDNARQAFNAQRLGKHVLKRICDAMRAEISVFSSYLAGQSFGYQILNESKEIVDSCYGFYSEADAYKAGQEALTQAQESAVRVA